MDFRDAVLPSLTRQRFFAKTVHHPNWKEQMSGKNEDRAIEILEGLGYELDVDFVRQYPIGMRWVLDFAFVKERVGIEIDGSNHDTKKQTKLDHAKDKYLASTWYQC